MILISPEISIIVPVYKVEKYLPRCIESILAQTFTDFELILVDDGSPDNCGAICDEYAKKDSRITVVHQTNNGLSASRNAGIVQAQGEYLCFIDSDDIVSPDYCQLLYQAVHNKHCKIAVCNMERFASDDFDMEKNVNVPHEILSMSSAILLKRQMGREIEMGVCCKLFHHSVFERIRFMPGKLHEDIIFAGDLLAEGTFEVSYTDTPLYFYRQRADSIVNSQVNTARCSPDRIFAGNYLLECAKKAGFEYRENCLAYAVQYPWSFVDSIYVHRRFRENNQFLAMLQKLIRNNYREYQNLEIFSGIQRYRMLLFARSKVLYGLNAYARLFRVYLYRVLKLDAYSDGHGI